MSGAAYWREPPVTCEACQTAASEYRLGISVLQPGASRLPAALRGAVVWTCGAPACDALLRARATKACAAHGLRTPQIVMIGPCRSGGMPELPAATTSSPPRSAAPAPVPVDPQPSLFSAP